MHFNASICSFKNEHVTLVKRKKDEKEKNILVQFCLVGLVGYCHEKEKIYQSSFVLLAWLDTADVFKHKTFLFFILFFKLFLNYYYL